tara:strand:- start:66 stop:410 length:345 start_codon:yes stop_codon:yes gene_type:complete
MKFLDKEEYYGNIEYKLFINTKKKDRILSQFFFRMREGYGKAVYFIGVKDNGDLYITDMKYLLYSINKFINIIQNHSNFKLRIFKKDSYIFSVIYLHNPSILHNNDIIDFKYFN